MLVSTANRSVQRTVISATASSSSLAGTPGASAPARSLPLIIRQRRYSSSKHSSTPKQSSTPITSAPKHSGNSPSGASSKKKEAKSSAASSTANKGKVAKDGADGKQAAESPHSQHGAQSEIVAMPPSVPSTAHIDPKVVHLASIFAQHRPISLHQPVPPQDSQKSFNAIFSTRNSGTKNRSNTTQDVIYTLASAVKNLENAAMGQSSQDANAVQSAALNLEELAKTFRPFNVPPPPVPLDPAYAEPSQRRQRQPEQQGQQTEKQAAVLAERPPMPEGAVVEIVEAPTASGPLAPQQQPYRERMRVRKETWFGRWIRGLKERWNAISVKRQRKLKMKKHKYKKLMRRTRNLRRRLDRL